MPSTGGRRAISNPVIDSAIHDSPVSPAGVALESNIPADPRTLKLIKACEEGNLMLCRQLLSLGVDCNGCSDSDSPLLVAMAKSPTGPNNTYTDLIAFLIDSGADINWVVLFGGQKPYSLRHQQLHHQKF